MNGVREVPRPKPEWPAAKRFFLAAGLPKGLHSPRYPQGFSMQCHYFIIPNKSMRFLSANGAPREYHSQYEGINIDSGKSNIIVRVGEIMLIIRGMLGTLF